MNIGKIKVEDANAGETLYSFKCNACGEEWVSPMERGPSHCFGDCGHAEFTRSVVDVAASNGARSNT